jgi:hypothetical protein
MTARNDITGDAIRSRTNTQQFEDNWERTFRHKPEVAPSEAPTDQPLEQPKDTQG